MFPTVPPLMPFTLLPFDPPGAPLFTQVYLVPFLTTPIQPTTLGRAPSHQTSSDFFSRNGLLFLFFSLLCSYCAEKTSRFDSLCYN